MENFEVKNRNWKEMDQLHCSYKLLGKKNQGLLIFFKDFFYL